jgi:hypothetical protein
MIFQTPLEWPNRIARFAGNLPDLRHKIAQWPMACVMVFSVAP